jgi:membrane protein DedA with SNARE-associated domain
VSRIRTTDRLQVRRALRWAAVGAAVLALILLPFLLLEEPLTAWLEQAFEVVRARPLVGASVVIALLATDCVLPIPSSVVSAFAGGAFGWAAGAGVIWLGMTLGCLAGYALGASAGRIFVMQVVGRHELERAQRLFNDLGPATLVVARAVPVLAEASIIAAGAARMPLAPFLAWTALANAAIAAAYALTGAAAASAGSFLLVFLGLALVPAIGWTILRTRLGR